MRKAWLGLSLVLAGCGVKQDDYIGEYVEAECAFALECYPPAVLEFYGWNDEAECQTQRGGELTAQTDGCTYDKKAAKACLKAFKDAACPAEGEDPVLPAICNDVWTCNGDSDTDAQ